MLPINKEPIRNSFSMCSLYKDLKKLKNFVLCDIIEGFEHYRSFEPMQSIEKHTCK
jgi:hypothetical protein